MKKLFFTIIIAMLPIGIWAQKTAQVIWTEGNATLTFINSETVYAKGDNFNGETVTEVWSGSRVTNTGSTPYWQTVVWRTLTTAVFDESFKDVRPLSTCRWFGSCSSLTTIRGIENLNTSSVTNMSFMFDSCQSLTELDVTHFDTSKVTTMQNFFRGCRLLTELDVTHFDTSKVTNMGAMFSGCEALEALDLSNFNTENVTDMTSMFSSCRSIKTLDLSSFHTPKLTNMQYMFSSCVALESIDLSNFDTSELTSMQYTFYYCTSLKSLDLSSFRTSKLTNMYGTFRDSGLEELDLSMFDTSNVTSMRHTFQSCTKLTKLDISSFNTQSVRTMEGMFDACIKLPEIDVSHFNTSEVTNMNSMFRLSICKEIDVSHFDTSKVTDMGYMFMSCTNVTDLDVSNFDTQNVKNMSWMFASCSKLTSLDVTNFNTANVTNMRGMFEFCNKLDKLELRNFNTEKVTDMYKMFYNCRGLYYLDLTNFNTDNVTNFNEMFGSMSKVYVYMPSETNTQVYSKKPENLIIGDRENGFTCQNCWFYDDGRDLRLPYPFKAEKVTYERTIATGGNGNTIMFPCDFDVPEGMQAYQMKESAGQVTDDIIYFQAMAHGEVMQGCKPYLLANWGRYNVTRMVMNRTVDVTNTIDYYDLEGTTQLTSYDGTETVETTLKDGTQVSMKGTFRNMPNAEVADQGIYIFQAGNKWKQVKSSNTTAYIPPFRAYLTKSGGANGASLFNSSLISDDDVTGVSEIHAIDRNGDITRYDLSGRRISGSQGGIYVSKGKKVLTH